MARVIVAPAASDDLSHLISTLNLPKNTHARVKRRLRTLSRYPLQGPELNGRWAGFRFILGPWTWMLIIYAFDVEADPVNIVTIQDARSARSAKSDR